MFEGTETNWMAVIASAMAAMAIGMLWYSPALFGKAWIHLMNINPAQLKEAKNKGMGKTYAIAFFCNLVFAYVLSYFIYWTAATTLSLGLFTGFLAWLGFIATVMTGGVLWESKPWKLYFINCAYYLVTILVASLILVLWA